jgi:REP element-mobilizing transposase RayT
MFVIEIDNYFIINLVPILYCLQTSNVCNMLEKTIKNEFYHVYSRGVDKSLIFLEDSDYLRFIILLKYCNRKNSTSLSILMRKKASDIKEALTVVREDLGNIIIATLMPNHFHILTKCLEDGSVGNLMQKILISYAKYFNKKYNKLGHRLENTYKRKRIKTDSNLRNIVSYIYNNPAKILDKDYSHKSFLLGEYQMSKEQEGFVKNYPYTYKGPTFGTINTFTNIKCL